MFVRNVVRSTVPTLTLTVAKKKKHKRWKTDLSAPKLNDRKLHLQCHQLKFDGPPLEVF